MKKQKAASGIRPVLSDLVRQAARCIRGLKRTPSASVHELRVVMKKYRALLLLARPSLPARAATRADKVAHDLKDCFSCSRDEEVHRALLRELFGRRKARPLCEMLDLADAAGPDSRMSARGRKLLTALRAATIALPSSGRGLDLVGGWSASFERGRAMMEACAAGADDGVFHEWRKRVKEFVHQGGLVAPLVRSRKLLPRAVELATELGRHHDLAMLAERIAVADPGHRALARVLKEKERSGRRALRAGRDLYRKRIVPRTAPTS